MLTFLSLFAGIGGFELGFEWAGMACKQQVEIDDNCNTVLAYHWPGVHRLKDVRDVGRHNLETVDLVCGGFPCQDVSVAGRREGLDGERSGLWFEFIRVVEELKPKWIVVENVPGLLSSNEKRDFAAVLSGLGQRGYWWAYRILDAQFFGVPQRRRRVFVVGCLARGRAQEVLFERESSPWDTAPGREAGQELARDVAASLRSRGDNTGTRIDNETGLVIAAHDTGQGWWNQSDIAGTLRAEGENRPSRPSNIVMATLDSPEQGVRPGVGDHVVLTTSGKGYWTEGIRALSARDWRDGGPGVVAFRTNQTGAQGPIHSEELTDTLAQDHPPAIAFAWQQGVSPDDRSYPVRAGDYAGSLSSTRHDAVFDRRVGVRRLTPLECERLQGFPDGWTAVDGMSDSARYRMLGNAVCVPVAEWIGRQIMKVELAS